MSKRGSQSGMAAAGPCRRNDCQPREVWSGCRCPNGAGGCAEPLLSVLKAGYSSDMQDPHWQAVIDELQRRPELVTTGPTELKPFVPGLLSFAETRVVPARIVCHKGMVGSLPTGLLAACIGRARVAFANEVFVIFEVGESTDQHVRALEIDLARQFFESASLAGPRLRHPSLDRRQSALRVDAALQSPKAHFIHSNLLGHVPNPGFCGSGSGTSFHTIGADGLRYSGESPESSDGSILTVGDSFTYGDEVRDLECWPSQLQRLTGRRVLNGGVTGYGFDQIVLRAEQLADVHKPSIVIVSFIAEDIHRAEMRCMWWRDKPWFAIEDDQLVLKGVPVPDRPRPPPRIRLRIERVLLELPFIVQRLLGYHIRVHPIGFGLEIAQRLTERLAKMQADRHVKIVVMAQYSHRFWRDKAFAEQQRRLTLAILKCAATYGLATEDTFQRFATEPKPLDFYGHSHLTARGNLMIASLLAAKLRALVEKTPS